MYLRDILQKRECDDHRAKPKTTIRGGDTLIEDTKIKK